jgi:hypothetical protein
MKRPKFFEDIDRSLAGEEVKEEPATPFLVQYQPTDAEIAQRAPIIKINVDQSPALARSLASSCIDVFPLRWMR